MSVANADIFRQRCPFCLDFHAHFLHPKVFARAHPHSISSCYGRYPQSADNPTFQKMFKPELQIAEMDVRGVDMHVISSADVIQARSWSDPKEEASLCAWINDQAAEWVARFPRRFVGTCVVPLGDEALCLGELERAVGMGLGICVLPSNYRGIYLGDARFDGLWAAIRAKQLVAFVHPDGNPDPWLQNYAMWNSIGQSMEEVKVMSSLIYEGVLDRHKGVRIVMAHGGGYMPHYMGRLDRNYTEKPLTARNISKKPSEYLRDFYYDSCVYDPRTLEILVERVGADRVLLGGDYPVAAVDPIDVLASATGLSDEQRAAIAGGTAARLFPQLARAERA